MAAEDRGCERRICSRSANPAARVRDAQWGMAVEAGRFAGQRRGSPTSRVVAVDQRHVEADAARREALERGAMAAMPQPDVPVWHVRARQQRRSCAGGLHGCAVGLTAPRGKALVSTSADPRSIDSQRLAGAAGGAATMTTERTRRTSLFAAHARPANGGWRGHRRHRASSVRVDAFEVRAADDGFDLGGGDPPRRRAGRLPPPLRRPGRHANRGERCCGAGRGEARCGASDTRLEAAIKYLALRRRAKTLRSTKTPMRPSRPAATFVDELRAQDTSINQ